MFVSFLALLLNRPASGMVDSTEDSVGRNSSETEKLTATNDTFLFVIGCGTISFDGNVMVNDIIPEGITARVKYVTCSNNSFVSFKINGNFVYCADIGSNEMVSFTYNICDANDESNFSDATVFINVKSDFDCDGIFDEQDMDDDNDGIPDTVEGNGNVDTDYDGVPDVYDIDDDNDGIPDIREWQQEKDYVLPSGIDSNFNGWDDIYEKRVNNKKFIAVDTDQDGIPDFRDNDSDNDEISDFIEATDCDFDKMADVNFINSDLDYDGLDDAFDTVRYWRQECNSTGSNVPLPDHNNNGIADFREKYTTNSDDRNIEYDASVITFQNPNNGLFSIQIPDYSVGMEAYIKIFEMNGNLMIDKRIAGSVVNLDLTSFQPGIYIVNLVSPDIFFSKKLILNK